jgi:hypothetical protein
MDPECDPGNHPGKEEIHTALKEDGADRARVGFTHKEKG